VKPPAWPNDQIAAVSTAVQDVLGQAIAGMYLFGSALLGGLRATSDLDLLVVTERPTTESERALLVRRLTPISSRLERPDTWRPVELTVVVGSEVRPWRHPARMEFQFGEWMRQELDAGAVPNPRANPDLAVLISMVRGSSRSLVGPLATELLDPVPVADLKHAMIAGVSDLLADIETDTTNVLLTLARIWRTLETGEFSAKDSAADWALSRMPVERRHSLERARDVYRGEIPERSEGPDSGVAEDAAHLASQIERSVPD
jgi:streptomycin 3"-adenylyltransferase